MNAPATGLDHLRDWIGRTEVRTDHVTPTPIAALGATLDLDAVNSNPGAAVPPLWHWLYFLPLARQSTIGADGHPERGGFLPPVPLPRRMWAGGRLEFRRPLVIGADITRISRIRDVSIKTGRSGTLVFVTVDHEISDGEGVAIREEHDIVYRENPQPETPAPQPQPAPVDEAFRREIAPDPVLLFRYSALTFNGHRIHYDRPYVTEVEGYPGLIVHGPLIATLLLDLLHRNLPTAKVARFSFRAVRPVFDIHRFTVCGKPGAGGSVALWTRDHEGMLTMEASAELG
ncbi:MAG: MaoC family dehydratase N-terminal domain-containing protein [Burkholderiales bacterium]|nr:MaoC family dehydratase N-terminal domain-containing protein [Burkholderiales bacterium]